MSLIKQPSESELELLQIETFKNTNLGVTKVSDHSVLRGLIRGNARIAKKAMKDIALSLSRLFPDLASSDELEQIAADRGIAPRRAALGSSTYVRVVGRPNTVYTTSMIVSDQLGNQFTFANDFTMGQKGFMYVKVNSVGTGASKNVDAFTLTTLQPKPATVPDNAATANIDESLGHIGILNEYAAQGGRDREDDASLRSRIKSSSSGLSRETLQFLALLFARADDRVLKVVPAGVSGGKCVLSIVTVNGAVLSEDDLEYILSYAAPYMGMSEILSAGLNRYGVILQNAADYLIHIDMRVDLYTPSDFASVAKDIQQKFAKMVDWRYWKSTDRVEWTELLVAARSVKGVKYIPSVNFKVTPQQDIIVPRGMFPRFAGFILRDLNGSALVSQLSSAIDPVFYPPVDEKIDDSLYLPPPTRPS